MSAARITGRMAAESHVGFAGGAAWPRRCSGHGWTWVHNKTRPAKGHKPRAEVLLRTAVPKSKPIRTNSRARRGAGPRSQRAISHSEAVVSKMARLSLLTEPLINTNMGVKAV